LPAPAAGGYGGPPASARHIGQQKARAAVVIIGFLWAGILLFTQRFK